MKTNKIVKLLSIALTAVLLAGCSYFSRNDKSAEEESSVESVVSSESVVESSIETQASTSGSTSLNEADESVSPAEASESAVTFEIFVGTSSEPIASFAVENAEGLSVLEAMQNQANLDFNFNEADGVVDRIQDHTNDGFNTWMYTLNGQFAELGVVSQKLSAGDKVAWYYGQVEDIPVTITPAEGTATTVDETTDESAE